MMDAVRWEVESILWHERDTVGEGWEPFAFDPSDRSVIYRRPVRQRRDVDTLPEPVAVAVLEHGESE